MIRTAILAGIFLVLLSIAYSRPDAWPQNVQKVAAMVDAQPSVKAPAPAPVHRQAARVAPPKAEDTAAPPAVTSVPSTPVEPSPRAEMVRKEDSVTAPAPVAQETHLSPAQPASLIPAEPARSQVVALAPSPTTLRNPVPLVPPADEPARVAAPAAPPAGEMPLINVPARPVVTPWEAPPRPPATPTTNVAANDAGVKQPDDAAPKLMTPQERSRELYRLAREMEDTFIRKLAR
jgi:hypothetical protein